MDPSRFPSVRRGLYGVREGIRIGIDSIRANRFRSALTILGVAIGVVVVVAMAALVTGVRSTVVAAIESAGPRNLYVLRFDPSDVTLVPEDTPPWAGNPPLTLEEARRLDALPAVQQAVVSFGLTDPATGSGASLVSNGVRISGVGAVAESETWLSYREAEFLEGRNFARAEVADARTVVVVSDRLARDLFGGEREAVGARVRMTGGPAGAVPLTVVGVFGRPPVPFEDGTSHLAIVPYTTALRRMNVSPAWGELIVVPREAVSLEVAEDQIIGALRSARGLAPSEPNDFAVVRSTQLLEVFDRFTAAFFAVMLALSSIGLVVGGVGVVGIMMISVTERTREIGIRMAVGASRPEILWQFLVEAAVLTIVGGAIGLAVGAALAFAVAEVTPIPASIPVWAVGASLAMAGATGMIFGLVPAVRAARMEPVQALRHE